MRVTGGCHCGAIRFAVDVPAHVTVLDCNCSICVKTGFLHLIVPHGDFTMAGDIGNLTVYRFGTGVAEHLFCRTCGIKSFYQPRSHPDAWSVNLNALDDITGLDVTIERFDGQNWEDARAALQ